MKITTSYQSMPAIWHAYDADTYDGAEDAGPQLVGEGKTEGEAVSDLLQQIGVEGETAARAAYEGDSA